VRIIKPIQKRLLFALTISLHFVVQPILAQQEPAPMTYYEWLNRFDIWVLKRQITELQADAESDDDADEYSDLPALVEGFQTETWGPNIAAHSETNAIDPLTHTNTISGGGYYGREQLIGTLTVDPNYVAGTALIATISGGYDNVNNQLAGTIAGGAHHILYSAGNHGTIGGGSYNHIVSGDYSTIAGGGGGNAHQYISGTRSTIGGGGGNTITSDYATIAGGQSNSAGGIGSSISGGRDNVVDADYAFAAGQANTVLPHAVGSFALGKNVTSSAPGSINISGRGEAGQSILLALSNQTINTESVNLLGAGSWTTPIIPENGIWSGEIHMTAAALSGLIAAYKLSFVATANRIVSVSDAQNLADELGIAAPGIVLNNRRLLIYVTGVAGQTINWSATAVVSQANL
jgi:hypothetical protein